MKITENDLRVLARNLLKELFTKKSGLSIKKLSGHYASDDESTDLGEVDEQDINEYDDDEKELE